MWEDSEQGEDQRVTPGLASTATVMNVDDYYEALRHPESEKIKLCDTILTEHARAPESLNSSRPPPTAAPFKAQGGVESSFTGLELIWKNLAEAGEALHSAPCMAASGVIVTESTLSILFLNVCVILSLYPPTSLSPLPIRSDRSLNRSLARSLALSRSLFSLSLSLSLCRCHCLISRSCLNSRYRSP